MAMPPLFIMLPARIKNGIASRLKTEMPEKIRCAPVKTATSKSMIGRMAHTEETPSATAIGTPAISMIISVIKIIKPHKIAVLIVYFSFLCVTL